MSEAFVAHGKLQIESIGLLILRQSLVVAARPDIGSAQEGLDSG
jgi:hypothetical protein